MLGTVEEEEVQSSHDACSSKRTLLPGTMDCHRRSDQERSEASAGELKFMWRWSCARLHVRTRSMRHSRRELAIVKGKPAERRGRKATDLKPSFD